MQNLISCPFCGKDIESDSFFCDQCGEKLKICTNGHGFRKGKICSLCGTTLIDASEVSLEYSSADETTNQGISSIKTTPHFLVGKSISAKLELKDGAIIGRRNGEYIDTFKTQGYVSGTHAKIYINSDNDWEIIDLNSTNGTFINGKQILPQHPVTINIGDEVAFYDTTFIVE